MPPSSSSGSTPAKPNLLVYSVKNFPATSVTIYQDNRAAIVRETSNLDLKPGRNEIVITGITGNALKETFRVSGRATTAGLLTDLCIDLVQSSSESSLPDEYSSSNDDDDDDNISPESKQVRETIASLKAEKSLLMEKIEINQAQKGFLQTHSNRKNQKLQEVLSTYATTRESLFREHARLQEELDTCERKLSTATRKERILQRAAEDAMSPHQAGRKLRKEERDKRKGEGIAAPVYIAPPYNYTRSYNVKIVIECSIDNEDISAPIATINSGHPQTASESTEDKDEPVLKLSYIATGANWTPKHDLRLDTTEARGVLTYRAQYFNNTREPWNDCLVTLSTSRNTFGGVEDKVPDMAPWNIGLTSKGHHAAHESGEGLYSPREKELRDLNKAMRSTSNLGPAPMSQSQLHCVPQASTFGAGNHALQDYQMQLMLLEQQNKKRLLMAAQEQDQLYGCSRTPRNLRRESRVIHSSEMGTAAPELPQAQGLARSGKDDPYDSDSSSSSDDTFWATENLPSKNLRLATVASGSHGTTTNYKLPGKRTIPPSHLELQHVITEFPLSSVGFYHVAIPKLREAVFLNAWIVNTSSTYLLKGSAGLTVDGTYLGISSVPRCAPGEKFTISLGVDEDIQIRYSKPSQKLSSQARFMGRNTELVQRYFRKFTVQNTSLNPRPVNLLVMDQVPVSSDERLKITILNPTGLKNGKDKVTLDLVATAGHDKSEGGATQEKSVATVQLKHGGRISWQLELPKGKKAEGVLEYEMRMPDSEMIVSS